MKAADKCRAVWEIDKNEQKSIRMILGVSLNVIVIAVGVFIIFTAGSKAYTFGHNILMKKPFLPRHRQGKHRLRFQMALRLSSLQSSFMTKDL